MRCDEARRRLRADAMDAPASRHLESCAACFAVLEAGDPLTGALRTARPADGMAPAGLVDAVLARWRQPRRSRVRTVLTGALAAVAVAFAAAIELLVGAEPGRLAGLGALAGAVSETMGGALASFAVIRAVLLDEPAVLIAFGTVTVATFALWLRLAIRPPAWSSAR